MSQISQPTQTRRDLAPVVVNSAHPPAVAMTDAHAIRLQFPGDDGGPETDILDSSFSDHSEARGGGTAAGNAANGERQGPFSKGTAYGAEGRA